MCRRLLIPLFITWLSVCALAQRRTVPADLSVRVRYTNEQMAPSQLRVQLLTVSGTPMAEAQTDSRGQVDFEILQGNYVLRVTGVNIEDATTAPFTIGYGELTHTESVQVQPRKTAGETPPGGTTVSANTLKYPKKVQEAYEKGNHELAKQNWKKAREHLEEAVKAAPEFGAAQHNLGVACAHLEDNGCARNAFQAALRLDPKLMPAYLNLARLEFKTHNFPQAATLLKTYVGATPQDGEALILLSEAELKSGDYAAALADARRVSALPQRATYGIAHYVAARALEAQQHGSEAAQEYETFLRENPASPQAEMARAALERLKPR